MNVVLFFTREHPDYEWVLYEAVDQSDAAWDARKGVDRVDALHGYFQEQEIDYEFLEIRNRS